MYGMATATPLQFGDWIAVRSIDDLAYLVKESEIETGKPGRELLLHLEGQVIRYMVGYDGNTFAYRRVSRCGPRGKTEILPRELHGSAFGTAMLQYRVFCKPLPQEEQCCLTRTASTPAP